MPTTKVFGATGEKGPNYPSVIYDYKVNLQIHAFAYCSLFIVSGVGEIGSHIVQKTDGAREFH